MSVQAITWAYEQAIGSPVCKFVLTTIANEAGKDGITFRGQRSLAQLCACTTRTVMTHMAELEELGLLARARRTRANGSRTSDWIVLAPFGCDRGTMKHPDPEEYPTQVMRLVDGPDLGVVSG